MNTRLLCVAILIFTVLIFLGNQSAARVGCEFQDKGCENCKCNVDMKVKNPDSKKAPSCTVVFKAVDRESISTGDELASLTAKEAQFGTGDFSSCAFTVYCDKDASATLKCEDETNESIFGTDKKWKTSSVWGNSKCSVTCLTSGGMKAGPFTLSGVDKTTRTDCNQWLRPEPAKVKKPAPPPKAPAKKPAGKKPGTGMLSSMLLGESFGSSFISSFVPSLTDEGSIEEQVIQEIDPQTEGEAKAIMTDSTQWRPIEGEVGMEQGTLMVTQGLAEAYSFCTGDTIRLAGPNMMTMPTCPSSVTGRWKGAFARPRPKGVPPETPRSVVPMNLDLRTVNGILQGQLKTPQGNYSVTGSLRGKYVELEAVQAGTKARISLQGDVTKGSIVFGGSEQSAEGVGTYRLVGFFRQLFIADSALPPAIVNTPYTFSLTAFAPAGERLTFRLAAKSSTAATRNSATTDAAAQKEINWFTQAENLRGRNGERFSFLCPANGSTGGHLYGTDTYSDSSSICKAAVHAGLITVKAGGAVTIDIKPNAAAYPATTRNGILSSTYSFGTGKGSFVFAKGESPKAVQESPNVNEGGRLPKGITFDTSTGTFSGIPTEAGSWDLSVVADDGAGNVFEQPLTLTVGKMAMTQRLLQDAFVGVPYSAVLNITGGQPPYRFSSGMPRGLQLDPSTGEISGIPAMSGPLTTFDVTIRDSQSNSLTQRVTLSIRGTTILGSHYLPDASIGAPYRAQFQAVGNPSPVTWKAYPTDISLIGLVLNAQTGEISGTPTKSGSFLINMRAEAGGSVSRSFELTIE